MTAALRHRGPDAEGFLLQPGVAFGFRRLAIIDLESGDQPILNEDGTVAVVCNGEIYNFVELRHGLEERGHRFRTRSDAETIVHLYEEHGPGCVNHLRGMFGFALWDGRGRLLMLARDRFGIKPMHYALRAGRIEFASEQKALLAGGESHCRRADPRAIRDLLHYGFVPGARTLTQGIQRLPPAHYLIYREGRDALHRYWDVRFPADGDRPRRGPGEWAEALREKLGETVRMHMRSDVPVGAWLSSGIDSSAVAALACAETPDPIETVTLAFDSPHLDETRRYPTLDRYAGFRLRSETVRCGAEGFLRFPEALRHCEEPTSIMIPRLILAEAAARRVKVVVTGEGADEILGGYHWYRYERVLGPFSVLPRPLRRLMLPACGRLPRWSRQMSRLFLAPRPMGLERYAALHGPADGDLETELLSEDVRGQLEPPGEEEPPVRLPEEFAGWRRFEQLQYLDLTVRLPEFVNHSLDRASMAFGLEVRVPFLDHELAELCARIPPSVKMRLLEEKHVLRRAMRGVLPAAVIARRKHPMAAPNAGWWRGALPGFAVEALSEAGLRRAGYFNPAAVSRMLRTHRCGEWDYSSPLNAVLGVQLREELFAAGR